uniref:Uncharacterized protein n=1 Tax=Arundo donax TaxID=35708 RepID=A0A0A8Y3D1_ARUDO
MSERDETCGKTGGRDACKPVYFRGERQRIKDVLEGYKCKLKALVVGGTCSSS